MEVTQDELVQALRGQDPDADLRANIDPITRRISGIVVTTAFQNDPDIVRSQKMGKFLRSHFKERAANIGTLTVFSPSERTLRVAG